MMLRIRENCGVEIDKATGGDRTLSAFLAAITANESEGRRQAFRFIPELHHKLLGLLHGSETKVEGVTKAQLEKFLGAAENEGARHELLKRLAGLHGYTQLPGYCCISWKIPLDTLTDKEKHFELAIRRLEEIATQFKLPPEAEPAELGRHWSAAHPNGKARSALYLWRLQERMRLYLETPAPPAIPAEA
jgi:hypothetical protein